MSHDADRNPLISVIVRTKDRPELLAEALESVAAQTYRPLEVVVVDDGLRPAEEVASRLLDRLPLRYRRLDPPRGRVAAANAGVRAAAGEWIAFLDDDDLLRPGALEVLAEAAGGGAAVVYGRVPAYRYDTAGGRREPVRTFGIPFDPDLLLFENYIPIVGCLMPRAEVEAVGLLDESLDCFEDWDLLLRLAERVAFRFVDREVAEYRLFGEGFITGAGGRERQHRGRVAVFRKHHHRYDPQTLSRIVVAVKERLVEAELELREPERAARLAALEEGVAYLRRQVAAAREAEAGWRARAEEAAAELRRLRAAVEAAEPPPVSVVLVSYNGRHHLERCLPALLATRDVPLEVLVVDNGSTDGTVAWLEREHPEVRVLPQRRNLGFGAACTVGIRAASHPYVALLNADTEVDPGWLRPLLDALRRDPEIGAACSTLRLLERPGVLNARGGGMSKLGFGYDHRFGEPWVPDAAEREVLFPTAAAMLMRRRDFETLGGFDPAFFMYHEDVDLGWRMWLAGLRVVVCGRSEVRHLFGGTTRSERSMAWRERLGARHALRSLLVCYEPWNLARALKGLARLWWRQRAFGLALHAVAWNAVRLPGTLARRWRVQRGRRISDAELFRRGLILEGPYPPPAPELPRGRGEADAGSWIASPTLLPGESSALGRLGPGWYRRERVAGRWARATCGRARCWLKVPPHATGALELEVHVPTEAAGRTLTVRAGGAEATAELDGSLWQRVRVWVTARDDGLLPVELEVPEWVPHELTASWDFRRLGCAVASVRFLPDERPPLLDDPLVTVIIPTYNRARVLDRTLAALAEQTWRRLQVVVVDDGSGDATPEVIARWERDGRLDLVALRQENAGQGIARNRALGEARGELVLFLGDDIVPSPGLVEAHVAMHRRVGEPCAVVGLTEWDPETVRVTPALRFAGEDGPQFGYRYMEDGSDVPYTCFYTSNVSLPREVLGEAPFDPSFRVYGWEDVELGYRLSLKGLRIVHAAAARARHAHPMGLGQLIRRQIAVGRSLSTLLELHPELEADDVMPPARPPLGARLLRPLLPVAVPALGVLDRAGVPLPRRFLRDLFLAGFLEGRRRAARRGRG